MRAETLIRNGSISSLAEIFGRLPRSLAGIGVSRSFRLSLDVTEKRDLPPLTRAPRRNPLRRVRSEADLIEPTLANPCGARGSPAARLAAIEVEHDDPMAGVWNGAAADEVEYSGGGKGSGRKSVGGSGGCGGGGGDRRIGSYYQEMLRADPGNPLLLRNYGRFLHEVEGDLDKAEEYYGRAILANPDDGEVLSLYGRLIWESGKDCERAEAYYERAVKASPDDCYVLGSYAHFLWDEEEKEDDGKVTSSRPLVEAF